MPDVSCVHKKTIDGKEKRSLTRCYPSLQSRHLTTGRPLVIVQNQLAKSMHIFSVVSDRGISGITGLIGLAAAAAIVGMMKVASGAMVDLTPENMALFNRYKDVPTVKYHSVTSTFKPWLNHLF